MDSNSFVYELPITDAFIPNVFVSVLIVKGVDETNPVAGFRMGYLQLGVDTERREMNIDITSDVDRTSPQETVDIRYSHNRLDRQPRSGRSGYRRN